MSALNSFASRMKPSTSNLMASTSSASKRSSPDLFVIEERPVKRSKSVEKTLLKDVSAPDFSKKLELLEGPKVIIIVGPEKKEFKFPKQLICYHSPYFDRALNRTFKDGEEDEEGMLTQELIPVKAFEMVQQFMYTGQVNTQNAGNFTAEITAQLDFLHLAHEIALLGPFDSVVEGIKERLMNLRKEGKQTPTRLIRRAMQLPAKHAARKLVVDSCVKYYAKFLMENSQRTPAENNKPCPFQKVMDEWPIFAAELFNAFTAVACAKTAKKMKDPLTGWEFTFSL
ncbi:hypothetical protein B7494_g5131 [Chlorociboria aeruginascens]|nr:hypothetical protein B7494_g5131 [Chlorociboria aeruginascens]